MRLAFLMAAVSFVLLVWCALVGAQTTCPECYHDRTPPDGNGAGWADDRLVLQIYVDTANMSGSEQSAANSGVTGAANMWNDATADGAHTDYYIVNNLLN